MAAQATLWDGARMSMRGFSPLQAGMRAGPYLVETGNPLTYLFQSPLGGDGAWTGGSR